MTRLDWWDQWTGRTIVVNGCLATTVTQDEAYTCHDYAGLVKQRVAPLVWLAMPDHEATNSL